MSVRWVEWRMRWIRAAARCCGRRLGAVAVGRVVLGRVGRDAEGVRIVRLDPVQRHRLRARHGGCRTRAAGRALGSTGTRSGAGSTRRVRRASSAPFSPARHSRSSTRAASAAASTASRSAPTSAWGWCGAGRLRRAVRGPLRMCVPRSARRARPRCAAAGTGAGRAPRAATPAHDAVPAGGSTMATPASAVRRASRS